MATKRKSDQNIENNLTLHDVFHNVGDQLNVREVSILKQLYSCKNLMPPELVKLINNGYDLFIALEKMQRIDPTNFRNVLSVLRALSRQDLMQFVSLKRKKTGMINLTAVKRPLNSVMLLNCGVTILQRMF